MNTFPLIDYIINSGIKLKSESGKLKIIAPPDKLTPELMQQIKSKKNEIIELLSGINKSIAITPVEKKEYYHISSAQKRLYIIQQMDMGNTAYNMPQVIPFEERIEQDKVEDIFTKLIARHESLQTSFIIVNDEPVQKINEKVVLKIDCFQNQDEPLTTGIADEIKRNFIRPFDLSEAPLLRVGVIKTGEGKYTFLLDMHHIVNDGTSQTILIKEFMALYKEEELPPLRLQYKDYSDWQNSKKQRLVIKEQEKYWWGIFSDEVPALNLPTDYPRPVMQSFEGSMVNFLLTVKESRVLREIAAQTGATLYMCILSVFAILLARLSGQEDIVVGTPIAARRHVDLEKVIGLFVNTLAMRISPHGEMSYKDFLLELKAHTLEAYENQEYPFDELVDKISLNRDTGRNPIFDVMFDLLNIEEYNDDIPDSAEMEQYQNNHQEGTSKFDLTLNAVDIGERFLINIEYCTRLFKPETINRFISYFKRLWYSLQEWPNIKLFEMEMIPREEMQRILYEFNTTYSDYPKDKTVHQLFEEKVEQAQDNIALIGENSKSRKDQIWNPKNQVQLSYGLLNEESNRLAYTLMEKGVGPDSAVGIMVERSVEMIIGIVGILKSGGAYLPIDPEYPEERIQYMLKDSNAGILLTTPKLQVKVKAEVEEGSRKPQEMPLQVINIEKEILYFPGSAPLPLNSTCQVSPANLAYIIYTSGSTGKPKGLMVQHCNWINVTLAWKKEYRLNEIEVIALQMASFSFDVFSGDITRTLTNGGKLVICPAEVRIDPSSLYNLIRKERITLFESTPSLIIPLMDYVYENRLSIDNMQLLIVGSDSFRVEDYKVLLLRFGNQMRIINSYGVTEATIDSSYYEEKIENIYSAGNTPIGKPMPNMEFYILDSFKKLQPVEIPGELYIGGAGVTRGYLNNPHLTHEKFICFPHQFGSPLRETPAGGAHKNNILYRTGDLAHWLSDGNIEFLGRIDHQLKVRGFRIEPEEIEKHLLKHRKIKEAVVLAREDEGGEQYLAAYIVTNETNTSPPIPVSELRDYLLNTLPDYMIPSYFVPLERLPLTSSGKIDRKALPGPERTAGESYIAPRGEVETKLVEIWSKALKIEKEKIGIESNFFQLGGHSLKATFVVSKIQKEFQVRVPLLEVFKRQTIRGLSEYIKGSRKVKYAGINPVEKKEYYGLSPAQTRMYIAQQMYRQSTEYNMPSTLFLEGDMDKDKLSDAFNGLVKRQSSLRTSFITVAEKPVQKIQDELDFELDYYNISELGLDGNSGEKEKNSYQSSILQNFIRPFDLSKAPIMRTGLIKLNANEHILIVDTHHIITDGVSSEILDRDLILLYSGKELPPLKLRNNDFSEWQNSAGQKELLKKQEKYWIQKFKKEITLVNLPTDYKRNEDTINLEGNYIQFLITPPLSQNLKDLNQQMEVTLFMFLLAVYNILIYHYSGQEDIVIGSPVTGRNHSDLYHIVGMFVNMLALRNQPQGRKTFKEFLKEVQQNVLDAFANQDYQFDELVKNLQIQGRASKNPLFNIVLAVQNIDSSGSKKAFNEYSSQLTLKDYQSNTIISRFDLTIFAEEDNGKIHFLCRYPISLFKEQTIKKLGEHYIEIIDQVTKNPEIKLEEIILSSGLMSASHTMQEKHVDFDF